MSLCRSSAFLWWYWEGFKSSLHGIALDRGQSFEHAAGFKLNTVFIAIDDYKAHPDVRYVPLGLRCAHGCMYYASPCRGGICVISFRKANSQRIKIFQGLRVAAGI